MIKLSASMLVWTINRGLFALIININIANNRWNIIDL